MKVSYLIIPGKEIQQLTRKTMLEAISKDPEYMFCKAGLDNKYVRTPNSWGLVSVNDIEDLVCVYCGTAITVSLGKIRTGVRIKCTGCGFIGPILRWYAVR